MSEDTQAAPQGAPSRNQIDPAFFTNVNEYLELANRQANQQGPKRTSMASLYAAARFNAHVYLINAKAAGAERTAFLDYMGDLYRRMLNEHLDGLGAERGIDVGVSELAPPSDGTVPAMDVAPAGGEAA
jgi:hypothetical protein